MELSYWESRWKKDNIGFHMPGGYPGLKKHWGSLPIKPNPTVLVPLCGKAVDMIWLEQQGATVIGVEISEKAILEFMEENDRTYSTETFAGFTIYISGSIQLWRGDFLKLPKRKLPDIDLVYDKAALVALPKNMRAGYAEKLVQLCGQVCSILLHHFEYPQEEMPGPPFSVPLKEVEEYFGEQFSISVLEQNSLELDQFAKFQQRGLSSFLKEQLLFLRPG